MENFLSLFVATIALGTAIWSASATRNHNKLSVRPVLTIFESFADTDNSKGIYLMNCGFGPAIIRSFEVFFDGRQVNADSVNNLNLEIKEHLHRPKIQFLYSTYDKGDPIQAGEKIELFSLGPNEYLSELGPEDKAKFVQGVPKLSWKIKYESIYEETFEVEGGGRGRF